MAKSTRSRRVTIAAGALSLALVAPFVSPVTDAPTAQAVEASAFDTRYTTDNFWNANEAVVQGLELEPGDKVESTRGTGFQVRTAGCAVVVARPWSALGFRTGNQDIAVKVTKADGSTFNTTLRVDVVDEDVADNTFTEPDQCPTPEPTTTPETAPTSEDTPAEEPTTTSATEPTSTSNVPATTASTFNDRFPTANFWNQQEAVIEGLELQPGDQVAATTNTIFNWKFRNDDGVLTLIRPQSPTGFKSGNVDIPVRVTPANGEVFTTTLRVNVIDERPGAEWESQLASRYPVDFEKSTSAQPVEGITLPAGVTVSKTGAALPTGWSVSNDGTTIRVTPPTTFKEGDFDLPIEVNDGTDKFKATLKIAAKNPSKTPAETAGTVAGILGPILGSLIGAGTGSGLLGNIIGGLTGGGSDGGEGGTGGGGGRLINVVITNNANPSNIGNNNGSPNVVITNNANPNVIITDNVNPNVVITDNVNPNVVITDNVNPRDNLSNNGNPSVVITNNANPTVEIKDNLSNNGNPVITNNANPSVVITGNVNDNLRDNGSNNSVVVTGNANPVVTGNANPVVTGNANPVVTGNANPTVVITGNANDNGSNNSAVVTGNANPVITDNANNNGSNNSAVVTNNANPTVVITDNANPSNIGNNNGSNNSVVATGNANPEVLVTGNANGGLFGSSRRGGQNGEPAQGDEGQAENGRSSILDANVGVEGGSSDPRCIASLVALGLPLIAMIPLSMAGQIGVPGLGNTAVQAEKAFADAARRFNLEPAQLAAVGGGALGLVAAVVLAAAVRNCVPSVRSIDLAVGGSSNKPAETVAAPVVDTQN